MKTSKKNEEMKMCLGCRDVFPLTSEYFYQRRGAKQKFYSYCIPCHKKNSRHDYRKKSKERLEQKKEYYDANKIKILQKEKEKWELNSEENRRNGREYYRKNHSRIQENNQKSYYKYQKIRLAEKQEYYLQNKAKINEHNRIYLIKRRKKDYKYRIFVNLRRRMNAALKENYQRGKMIDLLGCSVDKLKKHLEKQFLSGMSWANYGRDGWHIDHIVPCVMFDLTILEQQKQCFHYINLQPLWAIDNLKKGSKILAE